VLYPWHTGRFLCAPLNLSKKIAVDKVENGKLPMSMFCKKTSPSEDLVAPRIQHTSSRAAALTFGITMLACVIGLGQMWSMQQHFSSTVPSNATLARAGGDIKYYDEVLTMSCMMAATTGDRAWKARYDDAVPKLDAAIARATELLTPQGVPEAFTKTDSANQALIAIEQQAFDLALTGKLAQSITLLRSDGYIANKQAYAAGVSALEQAILARADVASVHATHVAKVATISTLAIAVALVLPWLLTYRLLRNTETDRHQMLVRLLSMQRDIDTEVAGRLAEAQMSRAA